MPLTGNPVGDRPYPPHALRVADAKQIQEFAERACLSFEDALLVWEGPGACTVSTGNEGNES